MRQYVLFQTLILSSQLSVIHMRIYPAWLYRSIWDHLKCCLIEDCIGFNDDHLKKLEVCVCDQRKIMPLMQNRSDCVKLREQWLINRPAHLGKNQLKWKVINLSLFYHFGSWRWLAWKNVIGVKKHWLEAGGAGWLVKVEGRSHIKSFDRCMLSQRKRDFRVDSYQIRTE